MYLSFPWFPFRYCQSLKFSIVDLLNKDSFVFISFVVRIITATPDNHIAVGLKSMVKYNCKTQAICILTVILSDLVANNTKTCPSAQ